MELDLGFGTVRLLQVAGTGLGTARHFDFGTRNWSCFSVVDRLNGTVASTIRIRTHVPFYITESNLKKKLKCKPNKNLPETLWYSPHSFTAIVGFLLSMRTAPSLAPFSPIGHWTTWGGWRGTTHSRWVSVPFPVVTIRRWMFRVWTCQTIFSQITLKKRNLENYNTVNLLTHLGLLYRSFVAWRSHEGLEEEGASPSKTHPF